MAPLSWKPLVGTVQQGNIQTSRRGFSVALAVGFSSIKLCLLFEKCKHQGKQQRKQPCRSSILRPSFPLRKMNPLQEVSNNKMLQIPKLDFRERSPPKTLGSPTRLLHSASRVSPFKGSKAHMTDKEIFATSPKRLGSSSVKRNQVTLSEMRTTLAPSVSMRKQFEQTPSRMISGRRNGIHSEQPASRIQRPTMSSLRRMVNPSSVPLSGNANLSKENLATPKEEDESVDSTDMRTLINTKRNAESARSVLKYLKSEEQSPKRKKQRLVNFDSKIHLVDEAPDSTISSQNQTIELLQKILENQKLILERLSALENK